MNKKNPIYKHLSKLTAEILELREDPAVTEEYLCAIRTVDTEILNYFMFMGDHSRQRIMNVSEYRAGLKYGNTDVIFDQSGWIKTHQWSHTEKVEFRTAKDKAISNTIKLAQGKNGKWTYGVSIHYGSGAGRATPTSVFDEPFNTRKECLLAAIEEMRNDINSNITLREITPDTTNYVIPYMTKVVTLLDDMHHSLTYVETQLALF